MSYVKPVQLVRAMVQAGVKKANLSVRDLLIRGFASGALLGFATSLAFTATAQTKLPIVGAVLFPVGFIIVILLGLELITGSFGLVPLAVIEKKTNMRSMFANFLWLIVAHVAGSVFYAALYYVAVTKFGNAGNSEVADLIVKAAETKTLEYKELGMDGQFVSFVKAILCNWMVALGAVMAMVSHSTAGKIAAMWLPIVIFFAQGFEHSVVNMFVIPAGMMFGARVSFTDWWLWNQIPVTIGNFVGGFVFVGLLLYLTYGKHLESDSV